MRTFAVIALLLVACADDGPATDAELHEAVACDSDWADRFVGADTSDGCEVPCESLASLGTDEMCFVHIDPFPLQACDPGHFASWRGRRGCCLLHGSNVPDDFQGVKIIECE